MKHDDRLAQQRHDMVLYQLERRGIRNLRVLEAMRQVPREHFVPDDAHQHAYDDQAMPVGQGQTISQPYIVAFMTEMLKIQPTDTVLEIGTGTGYQTAILALLAHRVYTIERLEGLSKQAQERLAALGLRNVEFHIGDGSIGWPAPMDFDDIMVTAASPDVPKRLIDQLAEGGRLVVPVGEADHQLLTLVTRRGSRLIERPGIGVRFVKLIGDAGFEQ